MTTAEYLATLKRLGLSPHSKATAKALGVSPRMAQYYAAGRPLPRSAIVRLLKLLRRLPTTVHYTVYRGTKIPYWPRMTLNEPEEDKS